MELVTRTRRRAALTSRTTTTHHIQQLCPMNDCRVGSAVSVEERTSNQQEEHRAFYGQSWPSRYTIVRTSWYLLPSPYASLPANLERVAETWNRLAQSFWVRIASEFFIKTWRNAYLHVHDLGHIGKLEANLDSFKTALSTRFSLSMEMSRLTRDGTAEPVSRDQIIRHARGQGNIHFPCSANHQQDWQPYPVDPYSAICDDHTFIHTYWL